MRFVGEKWSKLHEESCAPGERETTTKGESYPACVNRRNRRNNLRKQWRETARSSVSQLAKIMQLLLISTRVAVLIISHEVLGIIESDNYNCMKKNCKRATNKSSLIQSSLLDNNLAKTLL